MSLEPFLSTFVLVTARILTFIGSDELLLNGHRFRRGTWRPAASREPPRDFALTAGIWRRLRHRRPQQGGGQEEEEEEIPAEAAGLRRLQAPRVMLRSSHCWERLSPHSLMVGTILSSSDGSSRHWLLLTCFRVSFCNREV